MIGAARDISHQKETEIILNELNEKLKIRAEELADSNVELERFAYVASHDLQEPLRMVSSFLQLLQKKYEPQLDETANKYISLAVDGANRMKRLINDLLQFSRVTSTAIALKPVDTNEIMQELNELFKAKIQACNGNLVFENMPIVNADKTQMTQLLQNLISNALKYKGDRNPMIKISAKENEKDWVFLIEDNGIGIDPKFFEKIFVIFQRLHNKDEYSGTGIGLAICKKIVERFNGKIWVESEPAKGSKFYFSIPK
jgi:light-regulated signal transduction histidine kinase (bacteriophytochrome)